MSKPSSFKTSRRGFVSTMAGVAALTALGNAHSEPTAKPTKGRLKQGICRGVFRGLDLDLDGICRETARVGALGIDLVGPETFPTLKKYGLVPTMLPGGSGIKSGINDKANHASIAPKMRQAIEDAASAGAPNVIVLAGDRKGLTDEESMDNCVEFLNAMKPLAEDKGVTLCTELLNSKVNHPGYVCDHTAWGVELCKRVNSPRVKLLYDIYHMQIMEGDIIRTIRDNIQYIGHFHTAGNPGRHQFDEGQELNYRPICEAIAELNFTGYLCHEYTPTTEPIATLEKMISICSV